MNIVVTCENHFVRTPDGRIWTEGQLPYTFWARYLSVFDSVRVVARVLDVTELPPDLQPAGGPKVSFARVPDYRGPQEYLLRYMSIASATARVVRDDDAVILRVSGQVSSCVERHLRKTRHPYAVEVVGDPYDVFAPGAVRHPLRALFRWWFPRDLRRMCGRACAATYVTERALQRRYPPGPEAFATHFSDVELSQASFANAPRTCRRGGPLRLIFVGTLAQLYKAPDVLIDAVAACVRDGLNIELELVGSGQYQPALELRAAALGLGNQVKFRGQLTNPEAVREALDGADLFVLPSRQEGLPRAMVEAMARALPCIGSFVGGIPELLLAEDLVPINDSPTLAKRIGEVLSNPARMRAMSARNLEKAKEYNEAPDRRRQAFYRYVKAQTESWFKTDGASFAPTPARA